MWRTTGNFVSLYVLKVVFSLCGLFILLCRTFLIGMIPFVDSHYCFQCRKLQDLGMGKPALMMFQTSEVTEMLQSQCLYHGGSVTRPQSILISSDCCVQGIGVRDGATDPGKQAGRVWLLSRGLRCWHLPNSCGPRFAVFMALGMSGPVGTQWRLSWRSRDVLHCNPL